MSEFTPTPEQKLALAAPPPLLVLAGAGTGKTTVLTRRIAQTILSGAARPGQVLALTFTDKAAAEMAERLAQVMGEAGQADAAREVTVGTFHSFGGLIIRENLLRLGFDRGPSVLSGAAGWRLLSSILDELEFDTIEISTGQVAGLFARLLGFFSRCKDHLIAPDDLDTFLDHQDLSVLSAAAAEHFGTRLGEWRDASRAYRRYEQAKRAAGCIDFGDHLLLPVQLLRSDSGLRDAYRRRFQYLFVDEYQDTNHAQRTLLLQLLDPASPRIMVIGDDDQAIYRWRGAVVHNILRFHQEEIFKPDQVTRVPMTLNRRSFPPILDLANLAIAEVRERHPKALGYHPDNKEGRAVIGHYLAASDAAEGRWIAQRILERVPDLRELPGKKRGFGAIAVLCRKRSLFEPVGTALEEAGIRFELVGGTGFYGRWEIRDVLSYLRVVARPSDDVALARVLRSARWRIGGRDIFHLGQWVARRNGSRGRGGEERPAEARYHLLDAVLHVGEVAGLTSEAGERLTALGAELGGYAQAKRELPLAELVALVIDRAGYRQELSARPGFDARVALLNLAKLEHLAREFTAGEAAASLGDFVEFVSYALESGEEEDQVRPVDEETNTVKVMTVHQAKGLEFPVVFVPGLAERVFPCQRRDETQKWWELPWELRGDREHLPRLDYARVGSERDLKAALEEHKTAEQDIQLDEERRLFYVAVTRAQRELYFSRAHWYGNTVKPRQGSLFWDLVVGSDLSRNLGEEECPAANPNRAQAGPEQALEEAECPSQEAMAVLLSGKDPADWIEGEAAREGEGRWAVLRAEADGHLARVGACTVPTAEGEEVEVTCSGLLLYTLCPRRYRYVYVGRLPVRPSPYAAHGREVHRRIEELSRPPAPVVPVEPPAGSQEDGASGDREHEFEDLVESTVAKSGEEIHGLPTVEDAVSQFRQSPYGRRPATYVELPFTLPVAGGIVRGRIDRLDRLPDGRWELIDFKSGRQHPEVIAAYRLQLGIYALVVSRNFGVPAASIVGHILFLAEGSDVGVSFGDEDLQAIQAQIETAIRGIAEGEFPPTERDESCTGCDYARLCADGSAVSAGSLQYTKA